MCGDDYLKKHDFGTGIGDGGSLVRLTTSATFEHAGFTLMDAVSAGV